VCMCVSSFFFRQCVFSVLCVLGCCNKWSVPKHKIASSIQTRPLQDERKDWFALFFFFFLKKTLIFNNIKGGRRQSMNLGVINCLKMRKK
jgi:hypothetical protein